MTKEKKFDRQNYITQFQQKGVIKPCSRCGHQLFSILDGYTFFPINETTGTILGGPTIPAILVVCNKCGAITPHALGVFENLNDQENGEENK
jgi:hypothetical protein